MTIERPTYTEPQPWSHDVLEAEFNARIVTADEDGTVEGYELLGAYQARRPYEDFRGKISWAQAVMMDHDDAVFARFRDSQSYTAHTPVQEAAPDRQAKGAMGGFVTKLLRRK